MPSTQPIHPPVSRRGRGKRTRGIIVGCPLRVRIDQYTGPPRRQYIGVPGKSIRVVVADAKEIDALFKGLARYLEGEAWRRR